MTDMTELQLRKKPMNLAIVYDVDPDAFIANFMPWLEITASSWRSAPARSHRGQCASAARGFGRTSQRRSIHRRPPA
ncbi:MAG: hypothetical protein ACR650_17590 [Methylocystis sp.]